MKDTIWKIYMLQSFFGQSSLNPMAWFSLNIILWSIENTDLFSFKVFFHHHMTSEMVFPQKMCPNAKSALCNLPIFFERIRKKIVESFYLKPEESKMVPDVIIFVKRE